MMNKLISHLFFKACLNILHFNHPASSFNLRQRIRPSDKIDSFIKPKQKTIFLGNPPKAFTFTDLDIIEPPNVKYANDIDRLIHDWDNTSYLVIKDISIPLKYWSQVFRWAKPKT